MQSLDERALTAPGTPAPVMPDSEPEAAPQPAAAAEIDGPAGPEPTRYGDWERKGRCIDF